jgi:hypothetical protein
MSDFKVRSGTGSQPTRKSVANAPMRDNELCQRKVDRRFKDVSSSSRDLQFAV